MLLLILALAVIVSALWVYLKSGKVEKDADRGTPLTATLVLDDSAKLSLPMIQRIPDSPMDLQYGAQGGSIESDLKILSETLRDCVTVIKDFDRHHLPDSPAIIRFLQGENPDRLAWIAPDHAHVNNEGLLLDRFGHPVVIHRLGGKRFKFRAAGPDGLPWTKDDVVVK